MNFTTGGIYQYCSRPVGGSPTNPLEQPRPGDSFEGRYHHQGKTNLAENQNSTPGGVLNIQTIHGSNSVMESAEPAQAATTTFISDAGVVRAAESHSKGPTLGIAKKSQVTNVEDIKKFLAKPISLITDYFKDDDTVSTFTRQAAFTAMTSQPLVRDKLKGFAGIRATLVFTIVVNANRFQQGRYMFCWIPMGGVTLGTNRANAYYNGHISTLRQRSQLHRVEIDLNCDTEAELVVPFSSAINWYPLAKTEGQGLGDPGYFAVFPYSTLISAGGSSLVPFKVYAHMEDVELFGAAVPQMGRRATSRIVKRTASEIEAKNANIGPVESTMATLSDVSNALSVVPLLAPFSTPASWVFDALRGVAASFGWSKPSHLAPAHRIVRNHAPYMGSVNNDDYSLPLSLDVKNSVEAIPGLGFTENDELDFLSFVTIPCYLDTVTWSGSRPNGELLYSIPINPLSTAIIINGNTHHTPLSFVASYFRHWRGGITFKIKIVKTEFHSGRLCITYTPENSVGTVVPTFYPLLPYLERKIYDIRECNEIILNVPYMSVLPYLFTSGSGKATSTGQLQIWVEDPLVAPANINSFIKLIVEVYGADDMEFAFPSEISQLPVYGVTPQMGDRETRNDCRLDASELTLSYSTDSIEASSKCMGERIRSFRSLIKAYSSLPNTSAHPDTASDTLGIYPFFTPGYFYDSVTPVTPINIGDLYGSLHGVFTYVRGGVRLALQIRDEATAETVPSNDFSTLVTRIRSQGAVNDMWNSFSYGQLDSVATHGLKVFADTSAGNLVQVSVPAYGQSFARLCSEHIIFRGPAGLPIDTASVEVLASSDIVFLGNTTSATPQNERRWAKFRAAADDADFAQFVSIMPMKVLTGI